MVTEKPLRYPLLSTSALAAVAVTTSLSIDMVVPSLNIITEEIGTSYSESQLILSGFVVVYACSLLTVPYVTLRLGEVRALIMALSVFSFGGIVCAFAPDLPVLLIGRALQAMGAAFGPILARSITRTKYQGQALQARLSDLATIAAIAPAMAPIIGAQLTEFFGWRSNFVFLATFGIGTAIAVAMFIHLKPGSTMDTRARILTQAAAIFVRREFLLGCVLLCGTYSLILLFVSLLPVIASSVFTMSSSGISLMFSLSVVSYIVGTRCVRHVHEDKAPLFGVATIGAGALLLCSLLFNAETSLLAMILSLIIFNASAGMFLPLGQNLVLAGPQAYATTAMAIAVFLQNVTAAIVSAIGTYVAVLTDQPIAVFGLVVVFVGACQSGVRNAAK